MGAESSSDIACKTCPPLEIRSYRTNPRFETAFDISQLARPPQNMRYQSAFYRLPVEVLQYILMSSNFTFADLAKFARIHPRFLEIARGYLYRTVPITIDEVRANNPGLNLCFYPEGSGEASRYSYSINPISIRLFASLQSFPYLAKFCHTLILRCTFDQRHRSPIISPISLFQHLLNTMPDLNSLRFEDYPCFHDIAARLDAYHQARISAVMALGAPPAFPAVSIVCHSWSIPKQQPFPSQFRISSLALIADLTLAPKLFPIIMATSTHSLAFLTFDLASQLPLQVFPNLRMLNILAVHQGLERYLFSVLPGLGSLHYLTLVGRERSGKEFELILAGNYLVNSLPPRLISLSFLDDTPTPLSLYNLAISLKPIHFSYVHWPNHDQPSFSITKQAFLSMGVQIVPFAKLRCELAMLALDMFSLTDRVVDRLSLRRRKPLAISKRTNESVLNIALLSRNETKRISTTTDC